MCDAYALVEQFPEKQKYVISQQLCKAALSIPSNIAEGRGRSSARDYRHFLMQARGSLYELETQVTAARRLGYIAAEAEEEFLERSTETLRVLSGLIRSVSSRLPPPARLYTRTR